MSNKSLQSKVSPTQKLERESKKLSKLINSKHTKPETWTSWYLMFLVNIVFFNINYHRLCIAQKQAKTNQTLW